MPLFDITCPSGHERLDVFAKAHQLPPCETCGAPTEILWRKANAVIGDEIDITVKHGLCHEDGTPRRFRSRQEWLRAQKEKGMVNFVRHVPPPGTDKSKYTVRWI